jgi:hypothetical protein
VYGYQPTKHILVPFPDWLHSIMIILYYYTFRRQYFEYITSLLLPAIMNIISFTIGLSTLNARMSIE